MPLKSNDLAAVLVPVYREALTPDEVIAIRHLQTVLGSFHVYLILPESLSTTALDFESERFADTCFASTDAYSRLMLSLDFYWRFVNYEYILIYQLDCLVFRDELEHWCRRGYDYVGAPLFKVKDDPNSGFSGACNGGLSLRKVSSFLQVLNSKRYSEEKVSFLADCVHAPFLDVRPRPWLSRLKKRVEVAREVRQGVRKYAAGYSLNEDHFWSGRASYFYPEFRMAPPEIALGFAFEAAPRYCFERNGHKLPFGAHAWAKYDRAFWEPYLIPQTPATRLDS